MTTNFLNVFFIYVRDRTFLIILNANVLCGKALVFYLSKFCQTMVSCALSSWEMRFPLAISTVQNRFRWKISENHLSEIRIAVYRSLMRKFDKGDSKILWLRFERGQKPQLSVKMTQKQEKTEEIRINCREIYVFSFSGISFSAGQKLLPLRQVKTVPKLL